MSGLQQVLSMRQAGPSSLCGMPPKPPPSTLSPVLRPDYGADDSLQHNVRSPVDEAQQRRLSSRAHLVIAVRPLAGHDRRNLLARHGGGGHHARVGRAGDRHSRVQRDRPRVDQPDARDLLRRPDHCGPNRRAAHLRPHGRAGVRDLGRLDPGRCGAGPVRRRRAAGGLLGPDEQRGGRHLPTALGGMRRSPADQLDARRLRQGPVGWHEHAGHRGQRRPLWWDQPGGVRQPQGDALRAVRVRLGQRPRVPEAVHGAGRGPGRPQDGDARGRRGHPPRRAGHHPGDAHGHAGRVPHRCHPDAPGRRLGRRRPEHGVSRPRARRWGGHRRGAGDRDRPGREGAHARGTRPRGAVGARGGRPHPSSRSTWPRHTTRSRSTTSTSAR